jgi:hypothetical protein
MVKVQVQWVGGLPLGVAVVWDLRTGGQPVVERVIDEGSRSSHGEGGNGSRAPCLRGGGLL